MHSVISVCKICTSCTFMTVLYVGCCIPNTLKTCTLFFHFLLVHHNFHVTPQITVQGVEVWRSEWLILRTITSDLLPRDQGIIIPIPRHILWLGVVILNIYFRFSNRTFMQVVPHILYIYTYIYTHTYREYFYHVPEHSSWHKSLSHTKPSSARSSRVHSSPAIQLTFFHTGVSKC